MEVTKDHQYKEKFIMGKFIDETNQTVLYTSLCIHQSILVLEHWGFSSRNGSLPLIYLETGVTAEDSIKNRIWT